MELSRGQRKDGPSPRGWGNLHKMEFQRNQIRAIPTRVGKSGIKYKSGAKPSGHPHAGGEIIGIINESGLYAGPSPRGWGNRGAYGGGGRIGRAIPTRVGKSSPPDPGGGSGTGHPHAGGEILVRNPQPDKPIGPSPRGWGNPFAQSLLASPIRAIPTRVGKSTRQSSGCKIPTGHPHAGGEIPSLTTNARSASGPSPRGWGNLCGYQ